MSSWSCHRYAHFKGWPIIMFFPRVIWVMFGFEAVPFMLYLIYVYVRTVFPVLFSMDQSRWRFRCNIRPHFFTVVDPLQFTHSISTLAFRNIIVIDLYSKIKLSSTLAFYWPWAGRAIGQGMIYPPSVCRVNRKEDSTTKSGRLEISVVVITADICLCCSCFRTRPLSTSHFSRPSFLPGACIVYAQHPSLVQRRLLLWSLLSSLMMDEQKRKWNARTGRKWIAGQWLSNQKMVRVASGLAAIECQG